MLAALLLLSVLAASPAGADDAREPAELEMQLVYIFEDRPDPGYVFVIGQSGFRSVESLKKYLATLPRGTELRWAPGCKRFGGEPLLSSEKDMKDFEAFLSGHGIRFVLVPGG
jgi:hypothetical protein